MLNTNVETPSDTLTVLRARGKRLSKHVTTDGSISNYEGAFLYDGAEVGVRNLQHLAGLLTSLLPRHDCCIVRGGLVGGKRAEGIRRLLHAQPDGTAPTLREASHQWLALDIDDLPCPLILTEPT